ncbi:MAG TPA: PA14 domain-containing protein, partial [Bacillota bacterium]|nr:PA14 domain-containing protein [Bacillota bacterium]
MIQPSLELPPIIATKLAQFERRRKGVLLLRGLAESLLILGGGLLLIVLLEWAFKPQLTGRIWLSWANYFFAGGWLIYRAGRLLQANSLRQVARAFETAAQQRFQERILSAVEMAEPTQPGSQPGVSAWMMGKTISLAAGEIRQVNPATFVDPTPARQAWKAAAGLALGLALACLLPGFGARARLALAPYASTAPLSKVKLAVKPGSCRLKQGAPLEIKVSANEPLDQARVVVNWEDGFRETVLMSRDSTNGFVLGLPAVSQGFRYYVEALDAESAVFTVKVDVPPRIARLQLLVQPPAYTQWSNRLVEGGSADFLLGSRVRLNVETAGEKVATAEFLAEGVSTQRLSLDNNRLTLDLQPTNAITYQLRLTGANRLQAEPGQKWTLRPVPDEPPAVRLTGVGTESALVQQDELLLLQAQASDDVGLKRVDLLVLNKEAAAVKALFLARPEAAAITVASADNHELKASVNYNLADLQAFPGDEVQFQLVATDVREQTTRSELLALTIGSPDKAAEAQMVERIKQLVSAMEMQMEYLKQTRTSWLSIGRNFKEDAPDAQRPAFTVLKSRLNEFGRELNLIGGQLVTQSETNHLAESRFMYRLGTTLSAWGKQQREVLLENCARLDQVKAGAAVEVIDQGRELFNRALVDLEQYRRVLTVLQGAFETDVLATRCDSAQGRYKRGLPIMRGQTNAIAQSDSTGPGLKASFFEGMDLKGRLLEQKVLNPRFDNYAPANRREQWSVRYEGEITISEAGDWTLGCLADDGVRLNLDGKSLLPPEAWAPHAATQYKADLKLTAGWHRVVLEFFQGGSESKLQLLAAKKGQALQEVPVAWLRPPPAPVKPQAPIDPALNAIVKNALQDRVRNSLQTPSVVPPAVALLTNAVQNENLSRLTTEKLPVGAALGSNLLSFSSWKLEEGQRAENQADELTAFSKEAQRLLREELEKYRWRYEGAAALKEMQTAIQELREINQDLRRLPYLPRNTRTEAQVSKMALARTWEKQLEKAAREATHNLFETAKQREATLAERTFALNATTKAEKELQPAITKLAQTLEEDRHKDEMVNQIDQRLNEISDRYRELNDLQEHINREHVAAEARKALPPARAFARNQQAQKNDAAQYDNMKQAVAEVQKAQRIAGDY